MKGLTKKLVGLSVVLLLILSLAGCGSGSGATSSASNGSSNAPAPAKLKVALLLPGPINDNGWNASAYQGLKEAETKLGIEGAYSENVSQSDQLTKFRDYAQQGYNVIIGHGFEFGDAAKQVAKEFPKVKFIVTSSNITQAPNLGSLNVVSQQAGFLSGVAAQTLTKTNKVAYVGGMQIPPITTFVTGFKQGVKYANNATGKNVQVIGALTGSFDDVAKAKETAKTFISQGSDVITQDADQAGLGVIQAAEQAKVLDIGFGIDQSSVAPDIIPVSSIQSMPVAIEYVIKLIKEGKWEPQYYPVGIEAGATGLIFNNKLKDKFSAQSMDLINKAINDLKSGTIDLNTLPQ